MRSRGNTGPLLFYRWGDDMDREKVINGLEICIDRVPGKYTCNECPYEIDGNYCEINLAKDILVLLKEQQERIETLESLREIEREGR
jgi:hypothetical protein